MCRSVDCDSSEQGTVMGHLCALSNLGGIELLLEPDDFLR